MTRRPAKPNGNQWSDEAALEALHLHDNEGLSFAQVARRLGCSKNAVLRLHDRTVRASYKAFPGHKGDGSMPPGWWRR